MQTQEEKWLLQEKYNGVVTPSFETDKMRLLRGEPLAYVIGSIPFLGVNVDVSLRPHIPRVETEFWMEKIITLLQNDPREQLACLDIFGGSGCIGLAVLLHIGKATMDFADCDIRCVEQIEKNIVRHNFTDRSRVFVSDVFEQVHGTYDYILANPPYIGKKNIGRVAASVMKYEPHQALFSGEDGLDFIRRFLTEAPRHLKDGGAIALEFDDISRDAVEDILRALRYKNRRFGKDQYDKWRYVFVSEPIQSLTA